MNGLSYILIGLALAALIWVVFTTAPDDWEE